MDPQLSYMTPLVLLLSGIECLNVNPPMPVVVA